jgi:protein-disulfide isomerase
LTSNLVRYFFTILRLNRSGDCYISTQAHIGRINQDIESGYQSGVAAAPALFINRIRYTNRWTMEQIMAAIAAASS